MLDAPIGITKAFLHFPPRCKPGTKVLSVRAVVEAWV
jgi:hypothetical protein